MELLGQVHGAHRKALQARQATLFVALAKLEAGQQQMEAVLQGMDRLGTFMDKSREVG